MKKGIFSILATLAVFTVLTLGCPVTLEPEVANGTAVTLASVRQDGSATSTTTALFLEFNRTIDGLSADDITLTLTYEDEKGNVITVTNVVKGLLYNTIIDTGVRYLLPISGFTSGGQLKVEVAKNGYTITTNNDPNPITVNIFYYSPPGATAVTLNSVTANGSATEDTTALTLTFSAAVTGLTADNITLSGMIGVTKGTTLTAGATTGVYILPISGISSGGNLIVAVANPPNYAISGSTKPVTINYMTRVAFTSLTANGSAKTGDTEAVTTTELIIAFERVIPNLSAEDITLTSEDIIGNVIKGTLTQTSGASLYRLPISGFTSSGTLSVDIGTVSGYTITSSPKTVEIYFKKIDVTFRGVEADGEEDVETTTRLTLTFDKAIPGLSKDDIILSGVEGVTKGELTGIGPTYILPISGFTLTEGESSGELSVTVANNNPSYNTTGSPKTVKIYLVVVDVTFSGVEADGSATETTTKLTLTFDVAIPGLSADDITLTGVTDVVKGDLTAGATAGVYTLPISGFTSGGTLSVDIGTVSGYSITGGPKTVAISYGDDFDRAVAIKDLAVSAAGLVTVDTETGIIARTDTTGYGNYFSVKIPAASLPIIASDTIVIKYIGRSSDKSTTIPITPKVKGTSGGDDLTSPQYSNFFGNVSESTMSYAATLYGATIPTEVLWFQSRPFGDTSPMTGWELKIIDITVTHGNPIKVTTGISIKPVAEGTPITTLDNLQYSGTVGWSSTPTTFAAGTAYTATISLTAKPGYTFAGIEADSFPVTGATTVTHEEGANGTLAITAVFPETPTWNSLKFLRLQ